MFERISAKTAALLGIAAGVALSSTTGIKPLVQFDFKVNFLPNQNAPASTDAIDLNQAAPVEHQQSQKKDPCPACGMG